METLAGTVRRRRAVEKHAGNPGAGHVRRVTWINSALPDLEKLPTPAPKFVQVKKTWSKLLAAFVERKST